MMEARISRYFCLKSTHVKKDKQNTSKRYFNFFKDTRVNHPIGIQTRIVLEVEIIRLSYIAPRIRQKIFEYGVLH